MARLGDLCRFINGDRGKNYPSQAEISSDGDVPFINAGHLVDGKLDFSDMNYISEEKYNQLNSGKIQENDVLYCLRGSLGKKAIIKGISKGAIASSLVIIRPDARLINSDYLFYALESPTVQEQMMQANNGSSQPNLSAKSVSDYTFNLPTINKQCEIVLKLAKVNDLISLRKEQLAKLDQLVKSRFIELFGMPGTDTNGWGLIPLGEVCQINPKKGQDKRLASGLTVSFVPMPAVSEKGEIDPSDTREYDAVKTGFTYFAENDVLFAKITPCMENGKGAVARGLYNGIGFGSTEFHVLRPINGKTNPYWIYMLTAFSQFREDAANNMTGSAGQRRVPASFLESYRVSVPPIELQEQFAAFVEQTDKSKLAIQQSLDKLELLKKSLMQ